MLKWPGLNWKLPVINFFLPCYSYHHKRLCKPENKVTVKPDKPKQAKLGLVTAGEQKKNRCARTEVW